MVTSIVALFFATALPASAQGLNDPCLTNPSFCNLTLKPDFEIVSISAAGCWDVGKPTLEVKVKNAGNLSADTYIDVWLGEAAPPAVGDYGEFYKRVNLYAGETESWFIHLPADHAGQSEWVDVIVDTDRAVNELSESNNQSEAYIHHAGCILL